MTDEKKLAARLKEARTAKGLTVKDWAALLGNGVSPSQVTDVERGKQKPPQGMLAGAVTAAGISPNWLLSGAGPMLATGKRADIAQSLAALQEASLKLAPLGLDTDTRDLAQEWFVAIDTGDVALIKTLAQRSGAAAAGGPTAAEEPPPAAGQGVDTGLMSHAVEAVWLALGRTVHLPQEPQPAVVARVVVTLYQLGCQGLEVDERSARSALSLAGVV